jgi:hypothetical protein
MKRVLLTAVTSLAAVCAGPGVASAAHHSKHHRGHHVHARHHARLRVLDFRAAAAPATTAPVAGSTPASPAGESAGTVTSFKEGVLTITLTDGTPVSGKVTENTEIHCQSATPSVGDDQDEQQGQEQEADDNGSSGSSHGDAVAHQADHGSGGDEGQQGSEEQQQSCTTAALVPGAKVREAELRISGSGAVWDHVDLNQ